MKKLYIGLVGEKGSGKGTFVSLFKKLSPYRVASVKFSDPVREALNFWNIPVTRDAMQEYVQFLNRRGEHYLSNKIKEQAMAADADIVLFDGMRWPQDECMVRELPNNHIVYITSDKQERFRRLSGRDENVGEKILTWEQFCLEEEAPNEIHIPLIGSRSDHTIINTELVAYRSAIEDYIKTKIKVLID